MRIFRERFAPGPIFPGCCHQLFEDLKRPLIDRICVTSQNLFEIWVVATRPIASNGFGLLHQTFRNHNQYHCDPAPFSRSMAKPDSPASLSASSAETGCPSHVSRSFRVNSV